MATVPQLLDLLAAQLGELAPSYQAALPAMRAAFELFDLAVGYRHSGDSSHLERQLLAVADSLSSLAVAASRALSSGAPPPWLGAQFQAGCRTLAACSNIANKLEHLTAASAFKIAAVCGLVFGPGTVLLQQMQRETAAAATPTAREVLSAMCNAQLAAVSFCMDDTLQTPIQPAAVAAFAGSTGKPTALLPWLLAVARVLTTIGASVAAAGRQAMAINFFGLAHTLLNSEAFAKHRAQLAADAELQQAVANVLLTYCLPEVAVEVCAELAAAQPSGVAVPRMLVLLPRVLGHQCLKPAVEQRLLAGDTVAAMRAVADLVDALPLPGSAEATQLNDNRALIVMHAVAIQVLAIISCAWIKRADERRSGGGSSSGDVSSSSGAAAAAESGSDSSERQSAAWQLVALVPRLTPAIQLCADSLADDDTQGWTNLESMCVNLATSLQLLRCLPRQPATPAQLASWAAAATAGIRLQPALLQLQASQKRLNLRRKNGTAAGGPGWLSWQLTQDLWAALPVCQQASDAAATPASTAEKRSAATALWQLHSTYARLCHWLLGQDRPALAGAAVADGDSPLSGVIGGLLKTFPALLACYTSAGHNGPTGLSEEARTRLAAMSAVHAEALAALTAHSVAAAAAEGQQRGAWQQLCVEAVLVSLPLIALYNDSAITQSLGPAIQAGIVPVLQDLEGRARQASRLADLAQIGARSVHLAVTLASSDLLGLLLQTAVELAGSSNDDAQEQAGGLLDSWQAIVAVVTDAASLAVDNAEVTGTPAAMVAQLKQGAHSLRQQRRQVLAGEQPDASLADRAAQLRQLLQPACELAGLFQQWLQLRGTVVQELLVASQAVTATRSCAYLRCANVAGQGVGTAKCRACRAVRYCGTACSHADWRVGHRRVCKALAAQRQAAKAARAAAAAAAGGQQQQEEAA